MLRVVRGRSSAADRVSFGLLAGGVLCRNCRAGQRQVVGLRAATLDVLRQFAAVDRDRWRQVPIDAPTRGEIRGVLGQYMCNLMDHRPRMHDYLGSLS